MGEDGSEWDFQRIGTTAEKSTVEKELAELRERMSKVEEWKRRRQEIEDELNKVWTEGGDELPPPPYAAKEEKTQVEDPVPEKGLETSQESLLTACSSDA
jgi:ATP-binding cassette, subfamily D (ALD), peroxisomal long-chain fatty acid import protein